MENTLMTQFGALGKVCSTVLIKNKQIHPLLIVLSKQRKEVCHTLKKNKKSQHKISYDSDTCDKTFANDVNHEKQQHRCNKLPSIYKATVEKVN